MNQGITVSENIISFLADDSPSVFNISEPQKCYEYLKQNHFVFDIENELFKKYFIEIEKIKDIQKRNEFNEYIRKLNENSPEKYNCNINFNIIELCSKSKDKIYFDPKGEEIKLNLNQLNEIEKHDLNSFLNPNYNIKLKHLPTIIECRKECKYNLSLIMEPFLRNAREIVIEDPYIRNENAIYNLESILIRVSSKSMIKVKTLEKELHDFKKDKIRKKFEDILRKYKIDLLFFKTREIVKEGNMYLRSKHQERCIVTEKYEIYIPGGLDQFYRGTPNIEEDDLGKYKIRIEEKKL
jgi:hypothetical protein